MSIFVNNRKDKATNATILAHTTYEGGFAERAFHVGPPMMRPTTDDARSAGMSCRRGRVESAGRGILYKITSVNVQTTVKVEGRTSDTNSNISHNITRSWDANTIDSASANAPTTQLDILLHTDALECGH